MQEEVASEMQFCTHCGEAGLQMPLQGEAAAALTLVVVHEELQVVVQSLQAVAAAAGSSDDDTTTSTAKAARAAAALEAIARQLEIKHLTREKIQME
jgi:hypothetical protein